MKFVLIILLLVLQVQEVLSIVKVRPYYRGDGVFVNGHYRRDPINSTNLGSPRVTKIIKYKGTKIKITSEGIFVNGNFIHNLRDDYKVRRLPMRLYERVLDINKFLIYSNSQGSWYLIETYITNKIIQGRFIFVFKNRKATDELILTCPVTGCNKIKYESDKYPERKDLQLNNGKIYDFLIKHKCNEI